MAIVGRSSVATVLDCQEIPVVEHRVSNHMPDFFDHWSNPPRPLQPVIF
jgi:hypothetical protein